MSEDLQGVIDDFETVKSFITNMYPELNNIILHFCDDAEEIYRQSEEERKDEGKPPRVYAHVLHHPNTVCASMHMAELTAEQRQGIFVHEFGHLFCERYPYYEGTENPLDREEDGDADYAVTQIFKVNLHYDDDDIEYVVLPIGSEEVEDIDPSEIQELATEEEEEDAEEEDEYGLGLPSSEDLQESIVAEPMSEEEEKEADSGNVIDLEPEND